MLKVSIVTPEQLAFEGEAREVYAPGWEGEFGILPGHDAYLSLMRAGVVTVQTSSGTQRFIVGRGFAEAGPSSVTLLVDSCESTEGVDKAAARQALQAAEADLLKANANTPGWDAIEERRELAAARIDA